MCLDGSAVNYLKNGQALSSCVMGYDIHALVANLDSGPSVVPRVPSMNKQIYQTEARVRFG